MYPNIDQIWLPKHALQWWELNTTELIVLNNAIMSVKQRLGRHPTREQMDDALWVMQLGHLAFKCRLYAMNGAEREELRGMYNLIAAVNH